MKKLSTIEWTKNIKEYGYPKFKEIVLGYVSSNVIEKCTDKEIRDTWKKLTGETINKL